MMSVSVAAVLTTLIVGGSSPAPYTSESVPPIWLNGEFQTGTSLTVPYPAGFIPGIDGVTTLGESVPAGVASTENLQNTIPGQKTVMGTSQGALVVDQVMADDYKNGVKNVSFVVIDDPNRGSGALTFLHGVSVMGYVPKPVVETPYDVSVVVKQYDGVANLPSNPASPGFGLAMMNAAMGAYYYHQNSVFSDLSTVPKSNITTSVNKLGGKTTTFLVPTPVLPLLRPLADFPGALSRMGVPAPIVSVVSAIVKPVVAGLNGLLKPIVDSAYPGVPSPAKAVKPASSVKTAETKSTSNHGGHHK